MLKSAVVMSRLRRLISLDDPWLVGLRATLRRIANNGEHLIIVANTAGSEFVRRGAVRLRISSTSLDAPDHQKSAQNSIPPQDRLVDESADVLYVLGLRTGGNVHQLLRERLKRRGGSVVLIDLPGLHDPRARQELCELGASIWQPPPELCEPFAAESATSSTSRAVTETQRDHVLERDLVVERDHVVELVPFPQSDKWQLLTHTTRACPEPWPGETFEQYADSLFNASSDADHTALGALKQIVRQRRLVASHRMIREGHRVVSFTACPLERLPGLHQYRTHLSRWDFEPYGICLSRQWLVNRGARPVIYGDEQTWSSLPEGDRQFFQLANGDSGIDWTVEQEWRHPGDIDLNQPAGNDVLLVVPNFESAKAVAALVNWPITLWPDAENAQKASVKS